MTNYLDLPVGDKAPDIITAVIEIPQGGINKYEYDKELHVFRLDRNLYSPVHYPGDYGFIPQTVAEDGDPLDILVLGDAPTFPGCIYDARVIGLFEMLDQGIRDEKVLAYATGNPRFSSVENYTDVQPHILLRISSRFTKILRERGQRFWVGRNGRLHTRSFGSRTSAIRKRMLMLSSHRQRERVVCDASIPYRTRVGRRFTWKDRLALLRRS